MPQADLFYTDDQNISPVDILREVEEVVLAHDSQAGNCKGRAHKVAEFHHSHILLRLSLLPLAHRGEPFITQLGNALTTAIKAHGHNKCAVNVQINLDLAHYY